MTVHRFFVDPLLLPEESKEIILPESVSYQIKKVLRLKPGDKIILCDGNCNEYLCELFRHSGEARSADSRIDSGQVKDALGTRMTAIILEKRINMNEPKLFLILYQSLVPREKFEDVLEKATEIGVSRFVPLETSRTQVHAKDIDEKKLTRWQKIIQEAAEQSERGIVPQILPAQKFESAITDALKNGKVLVAWEKEHEKSRHSGEQSDARIPTGSLQSDDSRVITSTSQDDKTLSLFIGSEGGFTDEEIKFAREKSAQTISLGPRILRSETAGIIGSAVLLLF